MQFRLGALRITKALPLLIDVVIKPPARLLLSQQVIVVFGRGQAVINHELSEVNLLLPVNGASRPMSPRFASLRQIKPHYCVDRRQARGHASLTTSVANDTAPR